MNRNEVGQLFNRIMEDMERLADAMPPTSRERRHMAAAMHELSEMAAWMGFTFITKEQYETQRAKTKPKLRSVK